VCKTLEGIKSEPVVTQTPIVQMSDTSPLPWKEFKAIKEHEYLQQLFAYAKGNIKEMCRLSDLSRARLYQLINFHSIGASNQDFD
jgi:two-component system, NtrC family, response regulator